jgi:hypothetical protein
VAAAPSTLPLRHDWAGVVGLSPPLFFAYKYRERESTKGRSREEKKKKNKTKKRRKTERERKKTGEETGRTITTTFLVAATRTVLSRCR